MLHARCEVELLLVLADMRGPFRLLRGLQLLVVELTRFESPLICPLSDAFEGIGA